MTTYLTYSNEGGCHGNRVSKAKPLQPQCTKKIVVSTGFAAGYAALPNKRVKPIINTVLVPAHAQTSDPCVVLRSDELETMRLDCSMEVFRSNDYFISIDDVTNPGCPKLFISQSDPGGNRLALYYEVFDRYGWGKRLIIWMDEGFSSENEIEQKFNHPEELSLYGVSLYTFDALSGSN